MFLWLNCLSTERVQNDNFHDYVEITLEMMTEIEKNSICNIVLILYCPCRGCRRKEIFCYCVRNTLKEAVLSCIIKTIEAFIPFRTHVFGQGTKHSQEQYEIRCELFQVLHPLPDTSFSQGTKHSQEQYEIRYSSTTSPSGHRKLGICTRFLDMER